MGWGSWRGAGADGTIEIDVTGTGIVACGQECLQWDLGHVSGGEYVGCWVLQNTDLCRVGLLVETFQVAQPAHVWGSQDRLISSLFGQRQGVQVAQPAYMRKFQQAKHQGARS